MNEIKIEVDTKNINVKRGDIWIINIPELKEEGVVKRSLQKKEHPFLVTSNDMCNAKSRIITGVTITSKMSKAKLPTHVEMGRNLGLKLDSIALCEQPISIDKIDLKYKVGECTENKMYEIEKALKIQNGMLPPFSMKTIEDKVFIIKKTKEIYDACKHSDLHRMYKIAVTELRRYCNDYCKDYTMFYDDKNDYENTNTACAM